MMSPEVESPCSRSKTTLKQLKATNTRTQTEKKNTLTFELPILPEVTLNLRCKLASSFPYFMARDVSIFFSLREKLKCHSAAKKQRSLEKQKKNKNKNDATAESTGRSCPQYVIKQWVVFDKVGLNPRPVRAACTRVVQAAFRVSYSRYNSQVKSRTRPRV